MVAETNVRELSISKNDRTSMPANSKFLTLPTILTLGRVAAVPLLVATFYMDGWRGTVVTTSIFTAAAVTDWLDGYIARKMKMKSTFGAFLDPVADKITMSALREWAASQGSKLLELIIWGNGKQPHRWWRYSSSLLPGLAVTPSKGKKKENEKMTCRLNWKNSGFGVWGLGFGVWGSGLRVRGPGFGVQVGGLEGLGFGVFGVFRVWGLGFMLLDLTSHDVDYESGQRRHIQRHDL
ncbi:CDP-diacylglycerol--glycerol-3-phosphate 3-phosphatidyltransferase 1, chloroplastic, partial [Mucuna pruriens]